MKHVFTLITLLVALTASAQQHDTHANANHKTHSYMGSHGMALISLPNGDTLAYHMALYAKPHDFQLLYKLVLSEEQKTHINRHAFQTLLPDNFDLQRLIRGEKLEISADLYTGHFERGGEKIARFNKVVFEKQLYKNQLPARNATAATHDTLHFDLIALDNQNTLSGNQNTPSGNQNNPDNNLTLAIHKINLRPSFDAIVAVPTPARQQTQFTCNSSVAKQAAGSGSEFDAETIAQLSKNCLSRTPVYAEFLDFR